VGSRISISLPNSRASRSGWRGCGIPCSSKWRYSGGGVLVFYLKEIVVSSRFGFGIRASICLMVGSSGDLVLRLVSPLLGKVVWLGLEVGLDVVSNISI